MFAIVDAWDFPHECHPVFHGVKTTQHLGKIPGVPCGVCTVQFPGTATSRPALPGAGPMCLNASLNSESLGKFGKYYGVTLGLLRKFQDVQSDF